MPWTHLVRRPIPFAPTEVSTLGGAPTPDSTRCRLCDGRELQHRLRRDAKTGETLQIALCLGCGLVQQTDMPSDRQLETYYSHHYRADYKKVHQPRPRHIHRAGVAALDRLDLLARWLPHRSTGTRLLDVGAGGGEFVYLACRRGYDARGIEPNVGYSEFAQSAYGVEVRTAGLESAGDCCVDVVTMFHVFEHMAHPHDALTRIAGILAPGGHLFIEVPNILQADASPHNTYFRAHLYYYSRHTLAAAASRHFDLLEVEDRGNLKALLRRKAQPAQACRLPDGNDIAFIRERMARKGWLEYLTAGGGWRKPILRTATRMRERTVRTLAPRAILDSLATRRPTR